MKKIYSFLMLAVMALVMSFTAKAASVTINVDDPSRVSVQINYEEKTLVAGDNTFDLTIGNYTSISISAKEGALLKSVVNAAGTPQSIYSGMVYITEYPSAEDYNQKYIVTSVALAEARTASCKITVDKAANIGGLQMSSTNERVTLVDGENIVKFIPDMESPFNLSANYGSTFYKVTVDGTEVAESYSTWYLYVKDGSVVDIQTEFPDEEVTVNVAFATEEAKGALKGIMVDYEEVTPDADGNIKVKLGKTVTIVLDKTNYAVDSFTMDGSTPDDYSSYSEEYSFIVKEAANIAINAHKYGTFAVTINVEHPECVKVEVGNNNVLELVAGDNAIEVSENAASIKITKVAGCKITSILVNDSEASENGYDSPYGNIINIPSDGTVIKIVAEEIIYDNYAYIYIDDNCSSYSYIMKAVTRENIYLVKGENKIGFNNGEEQFSLNLMNTNYGAPAAIYLNGFYVTSYQNSNWTLSNGDIIRVFVNEKPEEHAITFAMAEGFENAIAAVAVDGKDYADWANGLNLIAETKLGVTLAEGVKAAVQANNIEIGAVDGVYTTTIEGATKVRILAPATSVTLAKNEITGTANPFAYALSAEIAEKTLKVKYSLNVDATAVAVNVKDAEGEVVATVAGEKTKGAQTVDVDLADLVDGEYTWEVAVDGAVKSNIERFVSHKFYHPSGLDIDNSFESGSFGTLFVCEGYNRGKTSGYVSAQADGSFGGGLYIFDPQNTQILNKDGKARFYPSWMTNTDNTFTSSKTCGADFGKVAIAEDGRIFVNRYNFAGDYYLYAESLEKLVVDGEFTSLLAGKTMTGGIYFDEACEYLAGPAQSFDVKGSGDNLKLIALSRTDNSIDIGAGKNRVVEYELGTGKELSTPDSYTALDKKYTASYDRKTNLQYDNKGGVWYCQYRGTPSKGEPALVYVDENGEIKYFEGKGGKARYQGALSVAPDGNTLVASSASGKVSVYEINQDEDGSVYLIETYCLTHNMGGSAYSAAWDIAGNFYLGNASNEVVQGYALPRAEAAVTKAASEYSFTVNGDSITGIEEIAAEEGEVEYYNLQGVKVANPEKGVFIKKQGGKTTKVVL